jgi:hypothetical protein
MLIDQGGDGVGRAHGDVNTVVLVVAFLKLARSRAGGSFDEASIGGNREVGCTDFGRKRIERSSIYIDLGEGK